MRLAPPYYFFLVLTFFCGVTSTWGSELGIERNFYSYFMHFSFLSTFDYRAANNILGVEWSLAIEVFWYLLIPFMVRYIGSWKKNLILIISMLLLYKFSRTVFLMLFPSSIRILPSSGPHFCHGLCFLLGIFGLIGTGLHCKHGVLLGKEFVDLFPFYSPFFFYFYRPFRQGYWSIGYQSFHF